MIDPDQIKTQRKEGTADIAQGVFSESTSVRTDELVKKALIDQQLTFILVDEAGLHMRPSNQIVTATNNSGCTVELINADNSKAEGNSILTIFLIQVLCNQEVTVKATGGNPEVFWREVLAFDFWQVKDSESK
jgi:phosphotransferase system HPr (HPr) family protein